MHLLAIIALSLGSLAIPHRAPEPDAPVLKRSITLPAVEGRIDHMAYDAKTKRLFVAALGNGSLEVIDLEKGELVKSIADLKEPQGVACIGARGEVAVACGGDGWLHVYDAATLAEKQKIHAGEDADNLRVDAKGEHLFVGVGSGAVKILDAKSLETTGEVKLSDHPESFQLDPDSDRIYVNVPGGVLLGGGEVSVGDRAKGAVTATWSLKVAGRNFPMALDAKNQRLYVGCRRPARLVVLDTQTGEVVASPECIGDADEVFVDSASGRLYVVGGDGAIDVFQTVDHREYKRTARVQTAPGARTGLLVPERHALYVAVPRRAGKSAEIREYSLAQ